MDYKCDICRADFYHKHNLTRHKSRVHGIKSKAATDFPCPYCEKKFSSKKNLSEHRVKIHNVKKLTISCQEENCDKKFHLLVELRNHLSHEHEIPNIDSCQHLEFEKYEDFSEWLAEEKRNSDSKYVLSSRKKGNNCIYSTFSCNRSGTYKPTTDDRKRQLKAQGTSKLGFHCTSNVQVKEMHSKVLVSYYKEHYNHPKDLSHIPIPKAEKEAIAGQLLQGVKEKRILKDIRKDPESNLQRSQLITRQDLHNIKKEFGLLLDGQGSVLNNDEGSVCAWVEEMKNEQKNPVLFYKRQDDEHPLIPKKDFMIVIMTNFQKKMLSQFGSDRVCIDTTHGISGYQFELITLLVIDEYEEGIPVAFCITSTVDTDTIAHFFQCVKLNISNSLKPSVFMSDDAKMFKNAWINVFEPCKKYLLCAWHVDRNWQKHLFHLKEEIRGDVYKTLKTLMYELDEEKFRVMLNNFCEMLNEDSETQTFHDYFVNNYVHRPEMWAYCFRKGAKINTNMHVENFHRSLKHIYLEGKKTKRVDKVINELLNLINDKSYDRYIKCIKGKITKRATQNFKRHRDGKNLKATIEECNENSWNVISSNKIYCVTKNHLCNNECVIACRICYLCTTAYSCTCHDYEITNFMCKHIHFVSLSLDGPKNFTGPISNVDNSVSITEPRVSNRINRHELNKTKITSLSAKLNSLPSMEENVAIQIDKHLNAIQHLMQITGEKILRPQNIVNSEPYNKKILKQKRFHSVKKPRSCKKVKLSNPSSEEAKDKKSVLLKQIYCSNNSSFDHKY